MQTPASILVVDDDMQNRRLLEVLLGPEGYVTRTAAAASRRWLPSRKTRQI